MVTAIQAGSYLEEYVRRYRLEYERFAATPPEGEATRGCRFPPM
jgi:hypothetical protein